MLPEVSAKYSEKDDKFLLLHPLTTPELDLPAGMKSDGFSSPWYLRWYVNRVEQGWVAAWVHDHCYQEAINSKAWADKLFYKNLRRCNVPKARAKKMYLAVRLFGKGSY